MHVLTIIRMYLGLSQASLAQKAGITQPDLSEMETIDPYGGIEKYRRVAECLGIPMEPIVKNNIGAIPASFFEKHSPAPYLDDAKEPKMQIGREGEEYIFAREKARLEESMPIHAQLVLPLFKMKGQRIGCDILSYDDNGWPIFIEVKTTCASGNAFSMTRNELESAKKLTEAGERYIITYINNWRKKNFQVRDIPYEEFEAGYDVEAQRFACAPKKAKKSVITGLAYFRKLRGLKERELAEVVGIGQHKWSLYETGEVVPSVRVLIQVSEVLDAAIDELMLEYPA